MGQASPTLDVIIIGGSISGLIHGLVLKRLGHSVRILERNAQPVLNDQGAGIGAREEIDRFMREYDVTGQPYALHTPAELAWLSVKQVATRKIERTSWDMLFYRLRANFDGLKSDYYGCDGALVDHGGEAVYDHGHTVSGLRQKEGNGRVVVDFIDREGSNHCAEADLVIAADGPNSTVRDLLDPSAKRTYAGYGIWRGKVPESAVSSAFITSFEARRPTRNLQGGGQVVGYMIPGINGALAVGSRTVNWAWYCTYPSGSPEFEELMTDTSSQRHRFSVPPGKVSPRIWTHQQALAAELLPADFAELVSKTTHPFVQLVTDVIASRASFFNGKVLLVGDALAGFRPHVFASTNQAALDALLLRDWLEGKTSLEEWEGSVLRYAREMSQSSIAIGQKIMFPESASKV